MKVHTKHDPIREFDAHVYYHLENQSKAAVLREKFKVVFESSEIKVGTLINHPIGPHPLPMFEINFKRRNFERIKAWLSQHHGELTVLIHEVTGDDPRDHTEGAFWLGAPVPLDFNCLDS